MIIFLTFTTIIMIIIIHSVLRPVNFQTHTSFPESKKKLTLKTSLADFLRHNY